MERQKVVVCCVASFLGLLSAAVGFAAEAMRIMGTEVEFPPPSGCIYIRSPAHILAAASTASLVFSKTMIDVAVVFPMRPSSNRTFNCLVVSLFTYAFALFLLVSGAAPYDHQRRHKNCFPVKPGAFAGGAVLSLVTVISGIITYLFSLQQ